jgi:hypothetical protein
MVDQVGVNGVLEVTALVVREEDVDGLRACVAPIGTKFGTGFGRDAVVDGVDDI